MHALKQENIVYKGVLYFGLMLTDEGPKVLEFNARFGDPETEVILPRLKSDILEIMNSVIDGRLEEAAIEWHKESAVCVVLASGGYPEKYEIGKEITGIEQVSKDVALFHGGTKSENGSLVTAGGRVLVASALGENYQAARNKAYAAAEKVRFENMHYRKDIGIK
jgi:phosphoribosylamine--glycine ligase